MRINHAAKYKDICWNSSVCKICLRYQIYFPKCQTICIFFSMQIYRLPDLQWCHMVEWQGISDHWQINCFIHHPAQASYKENNKALYYWSFVRRSHSLHKGPLMWKMFPCHNILMVAALERSSSSWWKYGSSISYFGMWFKGVSPVFIRVQVLGFGGLLFLAFIHIKVFIWSGPTCMVINENCWQCIQDCFLPKGSYAYPSSVIFFLWSEICIE